jgi:DNA-3-methyladenine glycosylase II
MGKPITADMLPKPEQMQRRAARWKPWRSVASWYLWRACELPPMQPGEQIQLS